MGTESTDLNAAAASAAASLAAESGGDTGTNTAATVEHTPQAQPVDEAEGHIEWLKANIEKIPAEKIAFADRKFQPEFTRRLNLLNNTKQGMEQQAQAFLNQAGVPLPEGKSAADLLYENEGKGFWEAVGATVKQQIAPITEQINLQKQTAEIQQMLALGQDATPLVKEHYADVLKMIDSDPDLYTLATQTNAGAKALPLVMRGAAYAVGYEKAKAEVAELKKQLDAAKVASRVGASTSKATGGPNKNAPSKPMTLKDIARESLAAIQSEAKG